MKTRSVLKSVAAASIAAAVAVAAGGTSAQERAERAARSEKKTLMITPCDGGAPRAVDGYTEGERLPASLAQVLANDLMASWLSRQPEDRAVAWTREEEAARAEPEPAQTAAPGAQPRQPTDFSARDYAMWDKELAREVAYGDKIFHDDKEVGSPEGIACAMCHPNASNTHPETYPKFQIQLKRVALLRDMINWCIENPVRGKKLDDDDPKLKALEAYILVQRKGKVIEPGKH